MLQVSVPGLGRKTVRMGDAPERAAQRFRDKVEDLVGCKRLNVPTDPETARWVAGLEDDLYQSLVAIGLAESRVATVPMPTLKAFADSYIESKESQIAERSIELLHATRERLVKALGASTPLDKITPAASMDWREAMVTEGLSEATVRLHSCNAKSLFNNAVKREILVKNPFRSLPTAAIAANRDFYLTQEDAEKILAKLDGVGLRLFFGLARFGGLRAPSETHILNWDKVNLDIGRMTVYAPKTGSIREVPIVPRLRELFEAARRARFDEADRVLQISRHNLHDKIMDAAKAAGVERWPNLLQTLRRAAASDFAMHAPPHAVAQWMGHGIQVSAQHYLQVPAELFQKVTGITTRSALHNALQHGAAQNCTPLQKSKRLKIAG